MTAFAPAQTTAPTTQPITTATSKAGLLLKQWWKEGTAAGNVGDWYDNRDRQHSGLGVKAYPQLSVHIYTPQELAGRQDWALRMRALDKVVFGNSSTSSPAESGGSNPRHAYRLPMGLNQLHQQYRGNNLYIYPEHRDHDPSPDGHGDLYPTNTPFLLISQGSSGSDQPFMRSVPFTLAAFRPEVKKKLVENGLLMPTVQMILRMSNNHLATPEEYLTGKAHPTVFEGKWVDDLKMVQLAHDIQVDTIPPMAQVKVVEEDKFAPGKDYLDRASENLADTPVVVARVWRAYAARRRMVVSAQPSFDLNKRPLKYQWVVLRGDAKQVTITPKKADGSVVELDVPYPARAPIAGDEKMQSSRIDIGLFVHNGAYWSAPAFVTFFSLADEGRGYAGGKLVDIGYGMGDVLMNVDWPKVMALFAPAADQSVPPGWDLLRKRIKEEHLKVLAEVAAEYAPAVGKLAIAREQHGKVSASAKEAAEKLKKMAKAEAGYADAESASKKLAEEAAALAKVLDAAQKAADEILNRKRDALGGSARDTVMAAFGALKEERDLLALAQPLIARIKPAPGPRPMDAIKLTLANSGVKDPAGKGELASPAEQLARERFNAEIMAGYLFPKLIAFPFRRHLVDQSLSDQNKNWRDVFRYQGGRIAGWTRYDGKKPIEFGADGQPK